MKATVVLDLAHTSDIQVCVNGDNYIASIANPANLNFKEPAVTAAMASMITIQLQACQSALSNLRTAIAAPLSTTKSDITRAARGVVDSNLTMLAHLVENVANTPDLMDSQREMIVHSAGMVLKTLSSRTKVVFEVTQNKESGSVHAIAAGNANAHLWEYTTDVLHFTNRIAAEPTTVASTDITGLAKLTRYAFFHKAILPNQINSWEGPVFLDVI
jgi:hypothetical protein